MQMRIDTKTEFVSSHVCHNLVPWPDPDPSTPVITITEDHSIPVDDDDYVKYYGLEAHTEGSGYKPW